MNSIPSPSSAAGQALPASIKVAVIGAGAMGSGIAHVAARAGHPVYLYDANPEAVARGKASIEKDLRFLAGKGKLAEGECEAILGRITPASRIADLADAGLVIEAIVEDLEVKRRLFAELEASLGADAILTSNTSSLSITAIASALKEPGRVAGVHFFNPAPRMALVEIVSGLATQPTVAESLHSTLTGWGKIAVHARSTPGFIVNRVARPYYSEALRVLAERATTPATIDSILRDACFFPMGPFELMDLIGLDVNLAVTRSVFEAYAGDRRYAPSLIQQELVHAGRLGRKSGRGFYDYATDAIPARPEVLSRREPLARVTAVGDLGPAEGLLERLGSAGVVVEREDGGSDSWGHLRVGAARLQLSDGRTASRCSADENCPNLAVFDLALDYTKARCIAIAAADGCSESAIDGIVGTLQVAGLAVSRIDDVAGLVGLRAVCTLANEAADGVVQGIGSAADIDTAMRHGTNYPLGPLAWAERIGIRRVARVLANLKEHYGEERYRTSPLIQRLALSGRGFSE